MGRRVVVDLAVVGGVLVVEVVAGAVGGVVVDVVVVDLVVGMGVVSLLGFMCIAIRSS